MARMDKDKGRREKAIAALIEKGYTRTQIEAVLAEMLEMRNALLDAREVALDLGMNIGWGKTMEEWDRIEQERGY